MNFEKRQQFYYCYISNNMYLFLITISRTQYLSHGRKLRTTVSDVRETKGSFNELETYKIKQVDILFLLVLSLSFIKYHK